MLVPVRETVVRELVDDMVLVSEDEMLEAMRWLLAEERVTAEPAAAASVAASNPSSRATWPEKSPQTASASRTILAPASA